jgi:uncharacterized protein YijF (DUF1287 family)
MHPRRTTLPLALLAALALALAALPAAVATAPRVATAEPRLAGDTAPPAASFAGRAVARARQEVTRGVRYDAHYRRLAYPGGDVDPSRGACADVLVRALRAGGLDLQRLVHDDVVAHPAAYPGVASPDASIDHRRVAVLRVWFERHAPRAAAGSFRAGDVVFFRIGPSGDVTHAGVVSDRVGARGLPLLIHNLGPSAREEDVLGAWAIDGHFRPFPD